MSNTLLTACTLKHNNTRAKVLSPDGETEELEISARMLQGDTLAPFLFIIVLDYAMRQAYGLVLYVRNQAQINQESKTYLTHRP